MSIERIFDDMEYIFIENKKNNKKNIIDKVSLFFILGSASFTLFFISMTGGIPVINRYGLIFLSIILIFLGANVEKKNLDIRQLCNYLLIGFIFGCFIQIFVNPIKSVRIDEFVILVIFISAFISSFINDKYKIGNFSLVISIIANIILITSSIIEKFYLNYALITVKFIISIIIFIILIIKFFKVTKRNRIAQLKIMLWALFIGILVKVIILLIMTQQSDYGGVDSSLGWRASGIWGALHIFIGISFFLILNMAVKSDDKFTEVLLYKISEIKYATIIISIFCTFLVFVFGIGDSIEDKKHVDWTIGLYNILASNIVNFGIFNRCSPEHVILGNNAITYYGCWAYPSGWINLGVWILTPFHIIGMDGISLTRLIIILQHITIIYLLGVLISKWYDKGTGLMAGLFYLTSIQILYYGEIFASQWVFFIYSLILLNFWTPVLMDKEISSKYLILLFFITLFGSLTLGASYNVMALIFFSLGSLYSDRNRKVVIKGFLISIISGISSLYIWIKMIDYYWRDLGGSEAQLFQKAENRSQVSTYIGNIDFYLITTERIGILLNVFIICGLITLIFYFIKFLSKYHKISYNEKNALLLTAPFVGVQLYYIFIFPQAIWQHDFMHVLWLLIPGAIGMAVKIAPLDRKTVLTVLLIGLILICSSYSKMDNSQNYMYNDYADTHVVQKWMNENVEEGDVILMSSDIYKNMLIVYLAQDDVLVRPVHDTSEYPIEWLTNLQIDIIIVNQDSIEFWGIEDVIGEEEWCEETVSNHERNNYIIIQKC